MKNRIWVGLTVVFLLTLSSQAADTVLLTDNFNSSSLDPITWTAINATGDDSFDETVAGNSLTTLSTAYMYIQHLTTGAGGAYKSKLLSVNERGEIIITRTVYVGYSGTQVSMPEEVVSEAGTVLLRWGYYYQYNDGVSVRNGFGGLDDTLTTGLWTSWQNEIITYDPVTGQGSYSINGGAPVTINGIPFSPQTTNVYLRGSAYGTATGQYKAYDDFTVSQTDRKLLSVNSAYGSPAPAVGDVVYDGGTTVTCSVANVIVDGIEYECTGWIGTGSVPASGTTNEVVFTLSADSSITWNWDTTLLDDDFNDGVLDTSKWSHISVDGIDSFYSSPGNYLEETNGTMRITHFDSYVDGGAYRSALLSVDDARQIKIERRTKVHAAYETVQMPEELSTEDGTTLLSWGYYHYNFFYEVHGFGGRYDTKVGGIWDEWFDETITYDPISGRGSYSLNGGLPVLISGTALPAGATNVFVRGGASGAYGGHSKEFDVFAVSQGETANEVVLTVASEQGNPAPAVGSFVYEPDTPLACSVENIITNSGTLYQCTGWTGTGTAPATGTTNAVNIAVDEDTSITWNWQTAGQWLQVNVIGNGSVNLASGFYTPDSVQNLIATPGAGSWFAGWNVDASGTDDASITMDTPITVTAVFRDDVLLADDFNDGTLSSSKWTAIRASNYGFSTNSAGLSLTESNGLLNITHDEANSGGAYQLYLPVSNRGLITIERRTKVSSSGSPRMLELLKTESGTTLLYWQYTTSGFGYGAFLATGIWDEWFDETITYDPITGESTYSINGGTPVPIITGEAVPPNTTHVFLQGGAAGDGTGYTKQFDTFNVSQGKDSSRATLTISSAKGTPSPSTGMTVYDSGTTITCTVDNAFFDGQTLHRCTGWSATGSVRGSGTSNMVQVTLTEDSSIIWNWKENRWMEVTVTGGGTVDVSDGWYAKGSEQTLTAYPYAGWNFIGWSGDVSDTNPSVSITMDTSKTVIAVFTAAASADTDGDGLSDLEENLLGSNPELSDSDGDGFHDKLEVDHGWNPAVSDQWAVDYILNNDSTFGLYTSNAVLDVAVGQVVIETAGGMATLSLQLEETDDLITWTNAGDAVIWNRPVGGEKKFFRVRSGQ